MHHCLREIARPSQRLAAQVVLLLAALPLLSGCAELLLAQSAVVLAQTVAPTNVTEDETNRESFIFAVADVWSALTRSVEHDGRKLVSRDDEKLTLRVSYPFSWLRNNWGGVLTIACEPVQPDPAVPTTIVRIVSDAKDSTRRVRLIGDDILGRLREQLRRDSAPQPSSAASSVP